MLKLPFRKRTNYFRKLLYLRGKNCATCNIKFSTVPAFQTHIAQIHNEWYQEVDNINQLGSVAATSQQQQLESTNFILEKIAFSGLFKVFKCALSEIQPTNIAYVFHCLRSKINNIVYPLLN